MEKLILDSTTFNSLTFENGSTLLSYLLEQPDGNAPHVGEILITDLVFHEMTGILPGMARSFFDNLAARGARVDRNDSSFLAHTKALADEASYSCPNRPGRAKRFLRLIPRHGATDSDASRAGTIRIIETDIGQRFHERIGLHLDKAAAMFHPHTPITVQDMMDLGLVDVNGAVFKSVFLSNYRRIQRNGEEEDKADALHDQITKGLARVLCPRLNLNIDRAQELDGLVFADLASAYQEQLKHLYCDRMLRSNEANTETNSRVYYGRVFTYGLLEGFISIEQLLGFLHQFGVLDKGEDGLWHPQCCESIGIDAENQRIYINEQLVSHNNKKAKIFKPEREPYHDRDGYPVTYGFHQFTPGLIIDRDKVRHTTLQGEEIDRDNVKILLNTLLAPLIDQHHDLSAIRTAAKAYFGEDVFTQMELNFTSSHRAKMPRDAATPYVRAHKDIARDRHNLGETSILWAITHGGVLAEGDHITGVGHDQEMAWAFQNHRLGDSNQLDYLLNKPGYHDLALDINRRFADRALKPQVGFCDTAGLMQIGRDIAYSLKKRERKKLETAYPFVNADYFYADEPDIRPDQQYMGGRLTDRIAYERQQPKLWGKAA